MEGGVLRYTDTSHRTTAILLKLGTSQVSFVYFHSETKDQTIVGWDSFGVFPSRAAVLSSPYWYSPLTER